MGLPTVFSVRILMVGVKSPPSLPKRERETAMALKDIFSRLGASATSVKGGMGQKGGNTLMVAVLEEFSARGVLVRKKSKGQIELLRFMEVAFEQSIDSPKLRLAHLFKQWGAISTKKLLVVSDEFTSTIAELPKPQKMGRFGKKKAQNALNVAARFEINPFLDYPAHEAMVSVYVPPSPKGEFDEYGLDDSTTMQAIIFALHEKSYESLEQVCASLKMKLVGVMPHEVFAFAHCAPQGSTMDVKLMSVDNERPRILVNWRPYDALVALAVNNMPVSFQQHEFASEDSAIESTLNMVDELVQDYEGNFKTQPLIILGGEGGEQNWRTLVGEYAPNAEVKRWDVEFDLPDVQSPGVVPARYMTALSAASQALCKYCHGLAVDNHIPLHTKIVAHPLALPAMILAFFIFCMGVEASWLKYQVLDSENTIAALEEDKKVLDAAVKKGQDAVARFNALSQEQRIIKQQTQLLDTGLLDRQYLLRGFLAGLMDVTPESVQLNDIQQFSDQVWFLAGSAKQYEAVSRYVVQLKNLPMVRHCRLEKSSQMTSKEGEEVYFSFSLQIRLEEE